MNNVFTPLLVSFCMSGTYSPACQKAVEATYIQTGYASEVNVFQGQLLNYGKNTEETLFGSTTETVNTLVAAGVIVKNKKADLTIPNTGLCDRFSTQIQPNSYGLKLEWHW